MQSSRYSCQILMKLGFFSPEVSNFMKIRPVEAELFHADGQTDRHDKVNSRFSQFCESAYKETYTEDC
jgi:hypothetical protein